MKKYTPIFYLLLLLALIPATVLANVGLTAFFTQSDRESIAIIWETESETQNSGYNVYRTQEDVSDFESIVDKVRVNDRPIAPLGELGGRYELVDDTADAEVEYYYWLEDIDTSGNRTYHGSALGRISLGAAINPVVTTPPPTSESDDPITTTNTPTLAATATTADNNEETATPAPINTTVTATSASATATPTPDATETESSGRVFITPSPTTPSAPTATPSPIPSETPTTAPTALPIQTGGQTDAPTATPRPLPTATNDVALDNGAAVEPTRSSSSEVDSAAQPTATPITEANSDESTTIRESSNELDEPTGDIALIDPETSSDVVAAISDPPTPTEVAPLTNAVGNAVESDPNGFGGEVTDVQQPNIVQPQADDSSMFLWFGLAAGGLLILVGAGFALLFFGNRNR